jgi:hypothetical protein
MQIILPERRAQYGSILQDCWFPRAEHLKAKDFAKIRAANRRETEECARRPTPPLQLPRVAHKKVGHKKGSTGGKPVYTDW